MIEDKDETVSVTMRLPKSVVDLADRAAIKIGYERSDRVSRTAYIRSLIEADAERVLNGDEQKNPKLF